MAGGGATSTLESFPDVLCFTALDREFFDSFGFEIEVMIKPRKHFQSATASQHKQITFLNFAYNERFNEHFLSRREHVTRRLTAKVSGWLKASPLERRVRPEGQKGAPSLEDVRGP